MTGTMWILIAAQIAMGGFDTLFHHEGTERLAWRPSQRRELQLHGVRNLVYAMLFATLAWAEPGGALRRPVHAAARRPSCCITLWDFVEEDRTRKLPASERVTHTLLALELRRDPRADRPCPARLGRASHRTCGRVARLVDLDVHLRGRGDLPVRAARPRRGAASAPPRAR